MKLLIVEDEPLTREGLLASIDWDALGIAQVFQADDGLNGLRIARVEKPEVILCDVRMPRMDGIRMAEQLKKILPDSTVIFMSGYSDKEYLKAAIKLKAVNYIEKPINPAEIREAVREARKRFQEKEKTRRNEAFHSMRTASALALLLTSPYKEQKAAILSLIRELSLRLTSESSFTTYLVRLNSAEPDPAVMDALQKNLEGILGRYHLQVLYAVKHVQYHVYHILGPAAPSESVLSGIDDYLTGQFSLIGEFFIARGCTVTGLSKAYQSYSSAVTLIQGSFYFGSGRVLTPELAARPADSAPDGLPENPSAAFTEALLSRDREACRTLLNRFFSAFDQKHSLLPCHAKELYYQLFTALLESGQKLDLTPELSENIPENIMEYTEQCFTFRELHRTLADSTEQFFDILQSHAQEDPKISLIKDYIGRHYSDESLSVREIGDYAHLSAPYLCTYFKSETGQTLNQYLTLFRMEKAKQLLSSPRYQIADISSKVGYSNGNYFGKSFKKLMGLSPTEYREKLL